MTSKDNRILRLIFLSSFVFYLVVLCTGLGCSNALLGKRVESGKKWTCDKEADEAMMRNDYKAGISLHERFLEKEPENALSLYHLGFAYGQTGDYLEEVSYYEKAIALGFQEDVIFFNLGMAYGELNQIENSIRAFKKALDINPDSADNHFGLGVAYRVSAADLAGKEFLEAIKIDPYHIDARLHLSTLYADKGELQRAAEQLRKILEIDPTHRPARQFLETIVEE